MSTKVAEPGFLTATKSRVVFVEGKDEGQFFSALARYLELPDEIQFIDVGGKDNLRPMIRALKDRSEWAEVVTSVGVVRDADNDPRAAFQSICDALQSAGLARPTAPLKPAGSSPQVMAMVLPDIETPGMLEDLCLRSVESDRAMTCVDEYFCCLEQRLEQLPQNPSKARVQAFLASREVLEEAHFDLLQECVKGLLSELPDSRSLSRIHTFLASRYKSALNLGLAAQAKYWPLDNPAFAEVRRFLSTL